MVEILERVMKQDAGKLSYFPFNSSLSLFTDAAWIEPNKCCRMGFVLVNGDNIIMLAGGRNGHTNSSIPAKVFALEKALKCCVERQLYPQNIDTGCAGLVEWMQTDDLVVNWWHKEHILEIMQLVSQCCNALVKCISRDLNVMVDTITKLVLKNP